MTVKELNYIYENIDDVSVRELYSAFVMYCKIVYYKQGNYDLKDIKSYCKWAYLLKESEKLKNELEKVTSYGRNEQLVPSFEVVKNIYKDSYEKVSRLSEIIDCYEHEIIPLKDEISDLFE